MWRSQTASAGIFIFSGIQHTRKQETRENAEKQPYRAVDAPTLKIDVDTDGKTLHITDADGNFYDARRGLF